MKLKLDQLDSGQRDLAREQRDFRNKMERRFDRTDSKIDRVLYGVITGLVGFVLTGGFDYYQVHAK
ncbi:hypothetical protein DFH27DRAFT_570713 [Peziza echinospora]|nr:hypothetical protein DFH27DRAFT_570713 [Peziza echinospora]